MIKTFALNNYLQLIQFKRSAIFAVKPLRVVGSKKSFVSYHYGTQIRAQRTKPINIFKRGIFTHYSINFKQHKNFYNFFESDLVGDFTEIVYQKFTLTEEKRTFQGYAEIINHQRGETDFLENKHVWLTNSFESKHFNSFVMGELRDEIAKRIIDNGETGSSWHFKRFERLNIIVGPGNIPKLTLC